MPKDMYEMTCESQSECTSWLRLFRAFDYDHDGFIPNQELRKAIRESTISFGLTNREIDVMTADIDKNLDGMIDFAEFCILMSRIKGLYIRHGMFRAGQMVVPKKHRTTYFNYLQKYRCFPPPVFMFLISLIQIGIYAYYAVESGEGISVNGPVPTKSPLILNPNRKTEVWRFASYMFIHIGICHLVFNVLTQLILGLPLELVHQWRVILVYIGGVIAGSLLVTIVDPYVYLAGASGGVYAILAAHLSELIMNWNEMEFNYIRALILFIMIGSDAGFAAYQRFFTDRTEKVSHLSHLGGFVAGLLLGVLLLRNFRKHRWERVIWWFSLTVFLILLSASIVLICFQITF
ncbi:unnamed protein product [Auanema sp. JU1783]|nr:unnamed protein product [Auanema sp. JU1783]